MSMSQTAENFHHLVGRGDIAEISLMATRDGQVQANRRFVNGEGYGVQIAPTASVAFTHITMNAMHCFFFPDGPLSLRSLPRRKAPWGPDLADLIGEYMSDEATLDEDLDTLMASGRITVLRFSRCGDNHWELGVTWAKGYTGPLHFAADLKRPTDALRALIAHCKMYDYEKVFQEQPKVYEDVDELI